MVQDWHLYIIQTASGSYYTGITTDPERRLHEHRSGKKGAKSLRGEAHLQMVFTMKAQNRSEASALEARVKKLSRQEKAGLVAGSKTILARIAP